MAVTRESLTKDEDFLADVREYAFARYGEGIASDQEVVDRFLSEYRGINTNSVNMISSKNFVQDTDDESAVRALARAYNKVDKNLETPDIWSTAGLKLGLDYGKYVVSDPLNLFGLGAGKIFGVAAAKSLQNEFMKTLVKTLSKGKGFVGGAAVEGSLAVGAEGLRQSAEMDLGPEVRTEYDPLGFAVAGTVGGVLGGALSASQFYKKTVQIEQGRSTIREADEAKTAMDGVQAPAAKVDTLDQLADPEEAIGAFVRKTDVDKDSAISDPRLVGRVQSVKDGIAKVKYTFKDEAGNRVVNEEEVSLDKITGLSVPEKDNYLTVYNTTVGKDSLPKEFVQRGKDLMIEQGFSDDYAGEIFSSRLTKEVTNKVERVVQELVAGDVKLQRLIDPTQRVSLQIAEVVRVLDADTLAEKLGDAYVKLKLSPEDFSAMYIADAHLDGVGLAVPKLLRDRLAKSVPDVSSIDAEGKIISDINKRIKGDDKYKQILAAQKKDAEVDAAYNTGFAKFVRSWLGSVVSGPATQVRDTLGLAFQLPGMTIGRAINKGILDPVKYEALGFDVKRQDLLASGSFQDITNLLSAEEYLTVVKHFSRAGDATTDAFFRAHSGLPADIKPTGGSKGVFRAAAHKTLDTLGKGVDLVSAYRRAIDERTTTSLYFARLNDLILDNINRGIITDPKIKNAMDVFRSGDPDKFISEKMQNEAVSYALGKTFRRPIQELTEEGDAFYPIMKLAEKVEDTLNQPAFRAGRFLIAFPRFLAALHHYTATRTYMLPVNAAKLFVGKQKIFRKEITPEKAKDLRKELGEITEKATAKQELYRQLPVSEKNGATGKALIKDLEDLSALKANIDEKFGNLELGYRRAERLTTQAADTVTLYGLAYALSEGLFFDVEPTDRYNIFKVGNSEVDLRPLFPLTQFLFIKAAIDRHVLGRSDKLNSVDLFEDLPDVLLGANIRAGTLQYIISEARKSVDRPDSEILTIIAETAGAALGNVINGFFTPIKAATDFAQTVGPAETRIVRDKRLDRIVDEFQIEGAFPISPKGARGAAEFINTFVQQALKGNPFEPFSDKPARIDPLTGDPLQTAQAPALKEFTGVLTLTQNRDVQREFDTLGINFYKDIKRGYYSRIEQYNVLFDKLLGYAVKKTLLPRLESPDYFSKTDEQKKYELTQYFGDTIQSVNKRIKASSPVLYQYHNIFRGRKRSIVDRALREIAEENPELDINLMYYGELSSASPFYIKDKAKRQAQIKSLQLLKAVQRKIKKFELTETKGPRIRSLEKMIRETQ